MGWRAEPGTGEPVATPCILYLSRSLAPRVLLMRGEVRCESRAGREEEGITVDMPGTYTSGS